MDPTPPSMAGPTPTMTIEELDAIHRQVVWLMTKRSGMAAFKALTLGTERLDEVVSDIATMYRLTDEERDRLKPVIADDIHGTVGDALNLAKTAAGVNLPVVADGKPTSEPQRQGHLATAATAVAFIAPKAAKAHPMLAAATVAYAAGTAGWFGYHAQAFNKGAYELARAKIWKARGEPDPELQPQEHSPAAKPLTQRMKQLSWRNPFYSTAE